MTLYLSRLTLARTPSAQALLELVDPKDEGRAMDAHHRLVWSVFTDGPDRVRDFLWRADRQGKFFALSARPPAPHPLFEPPETKVFDPDLHTGDSLRFVLRANATGAVPRAGKKRGDRVDVVMHALKTTHKGADRTGIAQEVGAMWLDRQGKQAGFSVESLNAETYRTVPLPRPTVGSRAHGPKFGIIDFTGTVRVDDPALFIAALGQGFGRAKAFGCGLMLIRRA